MSRFRGSIDVPLTRKGYCDAVDLGFAFQRVDVICHDWQQRTIDTARCLKIAHPNARSEIHPVTSQRLGFLEGQEVNEETLKTMQYFVDHPGEVPAEGLNPLSREPQSFSEWLREWFWIFDDLKRAAEYREARTIIVTHNRNIQALIAREGNNINKKLFDAVGPKPCEIYHFGEYLSTVRHAETSWGT
jgi:broad specificity phosphatase PhoE